MSETEIEQVFARSLDSVLTMIKAGEVGTTDEAYFHLLCQFVARADANGSRPFVKEIYEAVYAMKHDRL